jgi:large subunit ribosomal protein L30
MSKVQVKLVKSVIGQSKRNKATITALGLGKINSMREHELTPQIEGMLKKVNHIVEITEL